MHHFVSYRPFSLEFNLSSLNMGNIFLGSEHEYEVVLANKGDIEAIYTLSSPSNEFKFDPREGIVTSGGSDR